MLEKTWQNNIFMKMKFQFSPNYSSKVRLKKDIKFVIIHLQECNQQLNQLIDLKINDLK